MRYLAGILILGLTVLFHEFGHFLLARLNHITVEEFAFGMGPRLLSHKSKKSGTVYAWRVLPFGGMCVMLNEEEGDPVPGSFVGAKLWQRALVIAAGPVFNFILALVLSFIIIGAAGADVACIAEVDSGSALQEAGIEAGDQIISFDGHSILNSRDLYYTFLLNDTSTDSLDMTVLRDGERISVTYTPETSTRYVLGFYYDDDDEGVVITMLTGESPLKEYGLTSGDYLVAINGYEFASSEDLVNYLSENPLSSESVSVTYARNGNVHTIDSVTPTEKTSANPGFSYSMARVQQSFTGVVQYSFAEVGFWIKTTFKSIIGLFDGTYTLNDMSGPVGIVKTVGDAAGEASASTNGSVSAVILTLMNIMIMITANLGIVNLIPLPALDGGRLLLLLIEGIRRKPSNREIEARINAVGLVLLLLLITYITVHDIMKLF